MPYIPGDYQVICDRCGFQFYASECRMTWDNWFVCSANCWEPKHEQFTPPKPKGEKQSVPVLRKEESLNFLTGTEAPNDGYFLTTPVTGDDL